MLESKHKHQISAQSYLALSYTSSSCLCGNCPLPSIFHSNMSFGNYSVALRWRMRMENSKWFIDLKVKHERHLGSRSLPKLALTWSIKDSYLIMPSPLSDCDPSTFRLNVQLGAQTKKITEQRGSGQMCQIKSTYLKMKLKQAVEGKTLKICVEKQVESVPWKRSPGVLRQVLKAKKKKKKNCSIQSPSGRSCTPRAEKCSLWSAAQFCAIPSMVWVRSQSNKQTVDGLCGGAEGIKAHKCQLLDGSKGVLWFKGSNLMLKWLLLLVTRVEVFIVIV